MPDRDQHDVPQVEVVRYGRNKSHLFLSPDAVVRFYVGPNADDWVEVGLATGMYRSDDDPRVLEVRGARLLTVQPFSTNGLHVIVRTHDQHVRETMAIIAARSDHD